MTTIVSAFYPLTKSKHNLSEYIGWIGNFCQIPRPMVLFTDTQTAPLFERLRQDVSAETVVIVKEFDTYSLTSSSWMEFWRKQWLKDPESAIHNPGLYAVWAIKQECVNLAIEANPFGHDWYLWCDIGIQRSAHLQRYYMTFPDYVPTLCIPGHIHFLEVLRIPDMYISASEKVTIPFSVRSVALGAGCIVGDRETWKRFSAEYVAMLLKLEERNQFAGKEQDVFLEMLMEKVMPFRLFHATNIFGSKRIGDPWMSFPVILGGQAPAVIDRRFD